MAAKSVTSYMNKRLAKHIISTKKKTELEWVEIKKIKEDPEIFAKSRYLYWACFRGHIPLIQHILEHDKISPFARVHEGRSPLMASLIGKHKPTAPSLTYLSMEDQDFCNFITNRAQIEICSREYFYKDQELLEAQMMETDKHGNNALHFAFRTKKHHSIDLIIRAGFGDIDHRNMRGQIPKEAIHNSVLSKETLDLLAQFDPTSQKPREPDYLFVASASRVDVLLDQFKSLNENPKYHVAQKKGDKLS